jgi:protein-arginine kinase activator protein McsA
VFTPPNFKELLQTYGLTLEGPYVNNSTKSLWQCIDGCKFMTTWRVVNRRKGCIICASKLKLPYENVSDYLSKKGCTLLTNKSDYTDTYRQKLSILCVRGHTTQKTFKAFKKHGCSICHPVSHKYDIKNLKAIAFERGDTLISEEYVNAKTPLLFKCKNPNHEPYKSLWTTYNRKNLRPDGSYSKTQCRKCAYDDLRKASSFFTKEIATEGYKVLNIIAPEDEIPSRYQLELQCDKQHTSYMSTWNRWNNGKRCPFCSTIALKSLDTVRQELDACGLILDVEDSYTYTGNKAPIRAKCKKTGHVTWKSLQAFKRSGCSECTANGSSLAEREILDLLKEYNPQHKYKLKIPSGIKNSVYSKAIELDIYFPEAKLAIEYCGLYWHGSKRIESLYRDDPDEMMRQLERHKYKHQTKKIICDHYGIRLITIFEDEFVLHKSTMAACLENVLNRETKNLAEGVKEIFAHVISAAKKEGIPIIQANCDLRWDDGYVYEQLGFRPLKEISEPMPYIINKLNRKPYHGNTVGKDIIYDCGHQTWQYLIQPLTTFLQDTE